MYNLMVNKAKSPKHSRTSLLILLLAGLYGFMPASSYAAVQCDIFNPGEVRLESVIIYNTDIPGTKRYLYSRGIRLDCSFTPSQPYSEKLVFDIDPGAASNTTYPEVFDTNLHGVGIKYEIIGNPNCSLSDATRITCHINSNPAVKRVHFVIQRMFFKTAVIQEFGAINIPQGYIKYYLEADGPATAKNLPGILDAATGIVSKNGCTLTTPTINFNLGEHQQNSFNRIGATGREVTQPIILACNPTTKYSLSINGDDGGAPGVIKLTQEPGAASGIGVQLLTAKDNQPVNLTIPKEMGISAYSNNVTETIDITARYYQTETKVTPGSANASATFTMTYQ